MDLIVLCSLRKPISWSWNWWFYFQMSMSSIRFVLTLKSLNLFLYVYLKEAFVNSFRLSLTRAHKLDWAEKLRQKYDIQKALDCPDIVVILSTLISFKFTFWIYTQEWCNELMDIVLKYPPKLCILEYLNYTLIGYLTINLYLQNELQISIQFNMEFLPTNCNPYFCILFFSPWTIIY